MLTMAINAALRSELPLGRTFEEYIQMFNLSVDDLSKRIIGCGDGISDFNKRMKELGYRTISCDPVYIKSIDEIKQYAFESKREVIHYSMFPSFIYLSRSGF